MCQCAERRAVIVDASRAAVAGNVSAIVPAATFVARTLVQDAALVARRAAARARLGAGRP